MSIIQHIIDHTSNHDNLTLFHILAKDDGWACFESSRNGLMTVEEIDILLKHLTDYRKERVQSHEMAKSQVFYPCDLPFINSHEENVIRPPGTKRYQGVYFAQHPEYENLVKIGCSIDVFERMKTLAHECDGKRPVVLGFIETDKHRVVESYIHKTLKDFRKRGEWFQAEPALTWLKGLVS